jgi:hypothetical protein
MRLAKNAFLTTLVMLALLVTVSAQTRRSPDDNRNIAPTVGTGGPTGGPTGLFTVYDGQTLRRGEFTFSIAYSNFDRDPGNVDITEVPVSFQVGLSDHVELFFNTDAYRAIKVNNPQNLSSFYLPNSRINGVSPAAIIACPRGTGTPLIVGACFRPAGTQFFVQYPYVGGRTGNFGFQTFPGNPVTIGTVFGFPAQSFPTIGPFQQAGNGADFFPGVGSVFGSILPGIVLATTPANAQGGTNPQVYTLQPSYLPDAPFINRTYGQSAFNTMVIGGKIRFTGPDNSTGFGIIPFYRFYMDDADDAAGFNMLQRGASPGAGSWKFWDRRGDIGLMVFLDSRLRQWVNLSANVGYIYNSSVKADINGTEFTLLDRGDEFSYAVGVDFPVNRYFQPILEFRRTHYVGGRTPNAFENDPMDGIAGVRIFPARWFGFGVAYRHHFNQQDRDSIEDVRFNQNVRTSVAVFGTGAQTGAVTGFTTGSVNTSGSIANAFRTSSDPHGFILQFFAGRRNERGNPPIQNQFANVTAVNLDRTTITLPCPPGTQSRSGACGDVQSVGVRTTAVDPEGDVLTYSYTVSGGRITGQGANVTWDLTGVRPGSYTVTAAVDDGCGFCGTTQTTTITVAECTDCEAPAPRCECPSISVSGPDQVEIGDPITFTANVSGGTQTNVTYNWSVSNGTIQSGQGTPVITVGTSGLENTSVTATVDVRVDPDCPCPGLTSSATTSIPGRNIPTVVEEFTGTENRDQTRARVDNFIAALNAQPNARGIIFIYGTDREFKAREAQIREAFRFRGYPMDRVEIRRGGTAPGLRTTFWIVPQGADEPTP